jgi:hypothetical protein
VNEKVQEIETEVLPPESEDRKDEFARLLAYILDDLIPIPGTKYRIGLDPLIGLIPGLGDTSTAAFSSLILVHALRAGVPRVVLVRMEPFRASATCFPPGSSRTSRIIASSSDIPPEPASRRPPIGFFLSFLLQSSSPWH